MKTITSRDNRAVQGTARSWRAVRRRAASPAAPCSTACTCASRTCSCAACREQCIVSESAWHNPEVAEIVGQLREPARALYWRLPDALYNARQPGRTWRRA